jgi:hypothetical protein
MKSAARLIFAFQDGKCPPLYLAERDRISNAVVEKQIEDLPNVLDVFTALHAVGEEALLQADLGGREHLAHLVDQRVDQVVVDPLIALQKKAQQVEACQALRKLLQLLHGVVIDQRRVIGDALVGNSQLGQQRHRGLVQRLKRPAASHLAPHLVPREILRILFQRCHAISPVALEIEPIERLACGLVKAGIQQACQPAALFAERAADDVL